MLRWDTSKGSTISNAYDPCGKLVAQVTTGERGWIMWDLTRHAQNSVAPKWLGELYDHDLARSVVEKEFQGRT